VTKKFKSISKRDFIAMLQKWHQEDILSSAHKVRTEIDHLEQKFPTLDQVVKEAAAIEREIWYINGLGEGHSLNYLRTVEAAQLEKARQSSSRQDFPGGQYSY
jgi:hypothetical protein